MRTLPLLVTAAVLSASCTTPTQLSKRGEAGVPSGVAQLKTKKHHAFLGIAHHVVETTGDAGVDYGYRISLVVPGSAAHRVGLLRDDLLISFDDHTLDGVEENRRHSALRDYLIAHKQVGDHIELEILRHTSFWESDGARQSFSAELERKLAHKGKEETFTLTIAHEIERLRVRAVLGQRVQGTIEDLPDAETLLPPPARAPSPAGMYSRALVEETGKTIPWYDFLHRHAMDELWQGQAMCRMDVFRYIRLRPLKILSTGRWMADSVWQSTNPLSVGHKWLLPESTTTVLAPSWHQHDREELLRQLIQQVTRIGALRAAAFRHLSPEEQEELAALGHKVIARFANSFYLTVGAADEAKMHEENLRFFSLATTVALERLILAARYAMHFNDLRLHDALRRLFSSHQAEVDTSYGKVIVGAQGDTEHRRTGVALLVDVSGNDWYFGGTGAQRGVAIVVDLAGNDRYSASSAFAQGGAYMGVSALFDASGDDRYTARDFSQGASWLGAGILVDGRGNDEYYGGRFTQAAAFMGVSALFDGGGNDRYNATLYAQGVGGPCGIAMLIDRQGDDDYRGGLNKPSSYGVEGHFVGASQGVGIGFRGYARGGIGLLVDGAGNDRYQAGNFSMGTGYFFGIGLLNDRSGDDDYFPSRYGVAAAAHSAIGIVIEEQGNDRYEGNFIALNSAAWDLSLVGFLDLSGDDVYGRNAANGFNIGAAAHNGMSLLSDLGGNDTYYIGKGDQVGSNDYHGGSSFAFRYDFGGQDRYVGQGTNNSLTISGEYGFSLDWGSWPARDPESLSYWLRRHFANVPGFSAANLPAQ